MKLIWAEKLGKQDSPYLVRWVLQLKNCSFRIHKWNSSDDLRNPHDHEWDFVSIQIAGDPLVDRTPGVSGGYQIKNPSSWKDEKRKKWVPYFYLAEHRHSVVVGPKGAWTFLFTGPSKRQWGFWVPKKGGKDKGTVRFFKRNKYFCRFGHH